MPNPLRGLAARVEKEGEDGNLTAGKMKIRDHRVDVVLVMTGNVDKIKDKLAVFFFVNRPRGADA